MIWHFSQVACSYQCPHQFQLLPGHWPKRYWISRKLQKTSLFVNSPSNTRNNMKSQIKNKSNRSFNFGISISTLNKKRRDQCLLALLEGKNHEHLHQNNQSSYLNYLCHPLSFIISQGLLYVMFFSIKRIKKNSIICNKFLLLKLS